MARIRIIAVGKLKETYFLAAQGEYLKRLKSYVTLELEEVDDLSIPDGANPAQEEQVRLRECAAIRSILPSRGYLVTLDRQGKEFSSPEFAAFLAKRSLDGDSVTFVIGGSLGLTEEFLKNAQLNWSFSKLTFPHQLFRIMLLEQIYRAVKINRNEPYHR